MLTDNRLKNLVGPPPSQMRRPLAFTLTPEIRQALCDLSHTPARIATALTDAELLLRLARQLELVATREATAGLDSDLISESEVRMQAALVVLGKTVALPQPPLTPEQEVSQRQMSSTRRAPANGE